VAWNLLAAPGDHGRYPFAVTEGEVDLRPLVRAAVGELVGGTAPSVVSARFHDTLVAATAQRVRAALTQRGRLPVILTGGAFHNPRLVAGIRTQLADFDVYVHHEVPPGDGGIALGQILVASATNRHA
jgi:hydrogenase maturation protein HypF